MTVSTRPNVLFLVADQLNTRHLGCYPAPGAGSMHTPVIDSLARGGASFDRAYCQSPLCMPSRAAFNTGFYPHACRVLHNPVELDPAFPTLAELLGGAGYATGGFGHLGGDGIERGFTTRVDLVDSPLRDAYLAEQRYLRSLGTDHSAGYCGSHPFPEEELQDFRATSLALDWLDSVEGPFYLQVSFMKPHIPLLAPKRFVDLYDSDEIPLPPSLRDGLLDKPSNVRGTRRATRTESYTDEEFRRSILHYRALVSSVDELTGRILERIEAIGALGETIVFFFADHGDYAGEFGLFGKSGNFYDCLTHVPLVVSGPRELVRPGRYRELAGLVDLPPTVLESVGLAVESASESAGAGAQREFEAMQGRSLAPLLSGGATERPVPEGRVLGRFAFCETRGHLSPGREPVSCSREWADEELAPLPTDPYSSGPVSHLYDGMMVQDERYKLSLYGDGTRELYDLEQDPWERENLAAAFGGGAESKAAELRLLAVLGRFQMESWGEERFQRPLPYHYRATAADLIPERFRAAHRSMRPQGD